MQSVTLGDEYARQHPRRHTWWAISRGATFGFLAAIALLTAIAVTTFGEFSAAIDAADWVTHTLEVSHRIDQVRTDLIDAETGQRGYLLTGNEQYLKPYESGWGRLDDDLGQLRHLIVATPAQQERLATLEPLLARKLTELQQAIGVRATQGAAAAQVLVASDTGRRTMDEIRGVLDLMQQDEQTSLRHRLRDRARHIRRTLVLIITAASGALAFVVLAVARVNHANTARDRAVTALREAEQQLRTTLTSIGDAVITTDLAGRVLFINPVAQALTGWSEAAARGCALDEIFRIINEDTRQPIEHPVAQVLQRGAVAGLANHTLLIARDGREIPIDDSAAPIGTIADEHSGVVLVFRDITERRRAEAAQEHARVAELARAEAEAAARGVRELAASNIIGVVFAAADTVTDANDYFLDLIGYSHDDVRAGQVDWQTLLPPEYRASHEEGLRELVERGTFGPIEEEYCRRDGARVAVILGAALLKRAPLEWVCFILDTTERKATMMRLEEALAALKQADRQKNDFLAMLAHELRNPLAPIRNVAHLLRHGPADGELRFAREIIDRQVTHLASLLDDLLDMARITTGKIRLNTEVVDLVRIVTHAAEMVRSSVDRRQQHLALSLPRDSPRVSGDAVRLAQIVGNLLDNAAKYTPDGGQIHVLLERQGDQAVLRVHDTGIGIAPDLLPRIFEPFTQGSQSLDRTQGGLGIGLSLVHRLVEMHGGTIEAASAGPDQGSEFIVRLPVVDAPLAATDSKALATSAPPGAQRILVVDDNVDAAASLAALLQVSGHAVRTAHSGPEALSTVETFHPQIIFLDIGLPQLDGYEVVRRLRQHPATSGCRIVALTGYGQAEDRQRSREAGFDDHLLKPVSAETIAAVIRGIPPPPPP